MRHRYPRQPLADWAHPHYSPYLYAPYRRIESHVLRGFDKDQGSELRHDFLIRTCASLDDSVTRRCRIQSDSNYPRRSNLLSGNIVHTDVRRSNFGRRHFGSRAHR